MRGGREGIQEQSRGGFACGYQVSSDEQNEIKMMNQGEEDEERERKRAWQRGGRGGEKGSKGQRVREKRRRQRNERAMENQRGRNTEAT